MILFDANILLRIVNEYDPDYLHTLRAVYAYGQTEPLVIAHQTLYEFWAVATRSPAVNGLGMTTEQASRWIKRHMDRFDVLTDPPALLDIWADLVTKHQVTGFRAHDVRYVALAQALNIPKLMTYNVKHYRKFPITIIDPAVFS
ncbi:MAG: type II toxin-antitoxin system VapC family toxin [Phycisphaerales bacterium]|nr:type II toxin-antitoxin system VapC family toxin [Phycisphaerales bacterium]